MRHPVVVGSRRRLDFSSALYLGLTHPSVALEPWGRFSTGKPAALKSPPVAGQVERGIAALVGCESALLGPSTLHLFCDLFFRLAEQPIVLYMESGVYPTVRWASERAALRGVPLHTFSRHDSDSVRRLVVTHHDGYRRPVIVADALCTESGKPAPLADYLAVARRHGGWLLFDDTQSLGILGERRDSCAPYGRGGGGSWRWHDLQGSDVVCVSSLAKGLGVPVAVLCGSRGLVQRFKGGSQSRVHCSPPSVPAMLAARHALRINRLQGDVRRSALARLVRRFRAGLREIGLEASGGLFPVQNLENLTARAAILYSQRLRRLGVRTVLRQFDQSRRPRIAFVITARHGAEDIDYAVSALARVTGISRVSRSYRAAQREIVGGSRA